MRRYDPRRRQGDLTAQGWTSAVRPSRRRLRRLLRACECLDFGPKLYHISEIMGSKATTCCGISGGRTKDSHALRVSTLLDAISRGPHAEERLPGASRSTHGFDAALPPVPQSLQVPVIPEPADGVGNGLARRPRPVTEFARRLVRGKIHLLSRHPNPVERDERVAPGNARRQLRPDGDRKQHTVRDPEPGWAPADRLRHL